jgi:O-antigen biosynthesis protein
VLVSFIIPLYNCLPLTQAMVASLQATLPAGLAHEIILVDDGSTDGTRSWLKTLGAPFRVVLNDRNRGYAFSNNRGASFARGEFLALLNNDLVLLPGWLEPMLAALRRATLAGVVGNIQLDARTGVVDHTGIIVNLQGKPEHARTLPPLWSRLVAAVRRRPAVTGACLLIQRDFWTALGGFDEGFVNGGEDVDLCFRARAAGRETYVALNSVVRHHVSSSAGRKLRDEQNSHRLARRWHHAFLREATRAWCWNYLGELFPQPLSSDYRLVRWSLLHAAGVLVKPPPEAVAGLEAALGREFDRWEKMFNVARST